MKDALFGKKDWSFLALLLVSLIVFYPKLFLSQWGALPGDHLEQHYPWALLLAKSLKEFQLPFWMAYNHCGFPIAAESQIGIFYLPNLVLSFLLPFKTAYSYTNIVHFLIAAWSTYLYGRQINLSRGAAFISAFIFTFGTAYGGAYYNITSLKTIAWFPLMLVCFEKYYLAGKLRYLILLAVVLSQTLVAGYLQVASLSLMILSLYMFLRIFFFHANDRSTLESKLKACLFIAAGYFLAFILASPQIFLSYELALLSNRVGLTEDYAYIGSMSPMVISTLVIPVVQGLFRGNCMYGGIFSVILILCAVHSKSVRKDSFFRLWMVLILISLFLALGRWSPVYVGIIKLTHFYSFRTPVKFIVFICFGLAVISGFGFNEIWNAKGDKKKYIASVSRSYLVIIGLCLWMVGVIYIFLTALRSVTIQIGNFVVRNFIYGRIGRPHSLEEYESKLISFLGLIETLYSPHFFWGVWCMVLILISVCFILYLMKAKKMTRAWLVCGVVFLFVDLYIFTSFDIKKDFDSYEILNRTPPMIEVLKREKESGNLTRLYEMRKPFEEVPLSPSRNILYDIEDIGAYSPFVLKRYYETIGQFGNINDSNFSFSPSPEFVYARLKLLRSLGVSHVLSKPFLNHGDLKLIFHDVESESYLYELTPKSDKAFFVSRLEVVSNWQALKGRLMSEQFDPKEILLVEQSDLERLRTKVNLTLHENGAAQIALIEKQADSERWSVETQAPGFFILMNTNYPGWHVEVNGEKRDLVPAYGSFQAVPLEQAGKHELRFYYSPFKRA